MLYIYTKQKDALTFVITRVGLVFAPRPQLFFAKLSIIFIDNKNVSNFVSHLPKWGNQNGHLAEMYLQTCSIYLRSYFWGDLF